WIALALMARTIHWSLAGGLLVNAIAFAICVPLLQRFRHVKMPLITRRWYDIPLRASLVASLVATVVTLSGWVGPVISGILALFPVVFTSMMLILHPRIGSPLTRRPGMTAKPSAISPSTRRALPAPRAATSRRGAVP